MKPAKYNIIDRAVQLTDAMTQLENDAILLTEAVKNQTASAWQRGDRRKEVVKSALKLAAILRATVKRTRL
jgi:hypothetical protein